VQALWECENQVFCDFHISIGLPVLSFLFLRRGLAVVAEFVEAVNSFLRIKAFVEILFFRISKLAVGACGNFVF